MATSHVAASIFMADSINSLGGQLRKIVFQGSRQKSQSSKGNLGYLLFRGKRLTRTLFQAYLFVVLSLF